MLEYLVYGFLILIFIIGAIMFYRYNNPSTHYSLKVNAFRRLKGNLNKTFSTFVSFETDNLIKQTGLNISGTIYQLLRYTILFVWLVFLLYKSVILKYDVFFDVALIIIVWCITSPRPKFFGFTSPFTSFINMLNNNRRYKYNAEIYRCFSLLKNLAINKSERYFPSTYLIEELSKYTVFSKPIFNRLLGYWYESRYEEGKEYFKQAIGTDMGLSLVELFSHIDYLKPSELVNQIDHYQKKAKEILKSRAYRIKELKSFGIYGVVIFTGMIILLNFLVVSLLIDLFNGLSVIN